MDLSGAVWRFLGMSEGVVGLVVGSVLGASSQTC